MWKQARKGVDDMEKGITSSECECTTAWTFGYALYTSEWI